MPEINCSACHTTVHDLVTSVIMCGDRVTAVCRGCVLRWYRGEKLKRCEGVDGVCRHTAAEEVAGG